MSDRHAIAARFVELHEREGAFVIPNPWDLCSARLLAGLGFEALATTSAGFAATLGRLDSTVTLEEKLAHCRDLASFSPLPVSGDLENLFADEPVKAAANLTAFIDTGLAGGSIEDWTSNHGGRIYDIQHAAERVAAAVEAARAAPHPFVLTARAENLIRGVQDLEDTIRRLQAYAAAGADVLYAPGLKTVEEIHLVTSAVSRPVNVLSPPLKGVSVAQMAEAGAKRISIGGALMRRVIGAVLEAGREMRDDGTFGWTEHMASGREMKDMFG